MIDAVDPWFNFRATKYLVEHGFYKFWDWFDDRMHPPPAMAQCHVQHGERTSMTNTNKQEHGILSDESLVARSTPG